MKSVKFEYYEYSKKSKSKIWLHKAFKGAHYFRVMLLVPLDQGTQGNKGRKCPGSTGIDFFICSLKSLNLATFV